MPPLIGLTTSRSVSSFGLPSQSVAEAYIKSISAAGAIPLLIPLGLPEAHLEAVAERLDGILFTGGGDVHPERYRAPGHPKVNLVDEDRDRVEIHLVQQAVQRGIPFLGICRGLQVINVALGGTLYEDIQDQNPSAMKHNYTNQEGRDFLAHRVELDPHSRLSSILGLTETPVNSLHHQAVRRLADGLKASAFAPDGILEGFELPTHPFGLAVQWHPEWLQGHLAMRSLFQAFTHASDPEFKTQQEQPVSQR